MTSNANDLRVLVVASDPLVRAGLATLLSDQPGCTAVGQASGELDFSNELDVYRPDAIVWDLSWDPAPALERLADRLDDFPPTVALLSDASHAKQVWTAGALGLLPRTVDIAVLASALGAVARGVVVIDLELARTMFSSVESSQIRPKGGLTSRELEVLGVVAEGVANKTVARRLGISEHTVKFHLNAIMAKLGVQSRTEAVIQATRMGLISL